MSRGFERFEDASGVDGLAPAPCSKFYHIGIVLEPWLVTYEHRRVALVAAAVAVGPARDTRVEAAPLAGARDNARGTDALKAVVAVRRDAATTCCRARTAAAKLRGQGWV